MTRLLLAGSMKRRWFSLLLTVLSAFFCFTIFFGLNLARRTLDAGYAAFQRSCGSADVLLRCEPAPKQVFDEVFAQTEGIAAVSCAMQYRTQGVCADGQTRTVRLLCLEENGLLRTYADAQSAPRGDECLLSAAYARDFGLEKLDGLTLTDGIRPQVTGVCYLPLYCGVYIDAFSACTNGDVVDLYVSPELMRRCAGEEAYNLAFLRAAPDTDPEELMRALQTQKRLTVTSVERFAEEPAVAESQSLLELVLPVCRQFSLLLFLIGFLFICVFLSGAAGRSRDSAAILRADGMGVGGLFLLYFLSALLAVAAGMALSVLPAELLASGIVRTTAQNLGIPVPDLRHSLPLLLQGAAMCLLTSACAGVCCTAVSCRGSILESKRRSVTLRRARLRSFAVSLFSACTATLLILSTAMYRDAIEAVRSEAFDRRACYDAQVVYDGPVPLTELEALRSLPGVECAEPLLAYPAELSCGENRCRVMAVGVPADADLMRFFGPTGERARPQPNQLLIAAPTAAALGAEESSILRGAIDYRSRRIELECRICGQTEQYSSYCQVVSMETVTQYLDSGGVMNTALVRLEKTGAQAEAAFLQSAKQLPEVYTVQLRSGAEERFDRRFAGLLGLTDWIVLDGAVLGASAFLLLGYGLWRKNRKRDAIRLLLGDSLLRVTLRSLAQGWIGTALGFCVSVPLAVGLQKRLLALLRTPDMSYPMILRPQTLLSCAALTFAYLTAATLLYALATKRSAKRLV